MVADDAKLDFLEPAAGEGSSSRRGDADPVSGEHMLAEVRRRLPRALIVSRADVGHYPQLEDPAWVAANLWPLL